jgi:transcriptional regulator with XRE-family HTH domain
MTVLQKARQLAGISQSELAARAGTSQPAVARLEGGHASPTLATLERLVGAAGFDLQLTLIPKAVRDPVVDAYKKDVDRTLLRENLRRTIDDRLRSLAELQAFGEKLQNSVKTARRRSAK